MKKTVTVNLNGRVFTLDEDAYRLLDNYLSNLRIYFRKEEGASEIIADFEARIEELFSEKIRSGCHVITMEMVEEVISRVGKPADFADPEDAEEEKQTHFSEPKEGKKKFYRNTDDKMFGGVCSGVAAYFGWNVVIVRIVFIAILFSSWLGIPHHFPFFGIPGFLSFWIVPAYLVAWGILPGAHTAEQKLQMHGKPITVENIGKTVSAGAKQVIEESRSNGWITGFVNVFVIVLKIFLIGLGCLVGLSLLFALVIVVIALIAAVVGTGAGISSIFPSFLPADYPVLYPFLAIISLLLVLGIPVVTLIYTLIARIAKFKPLSRLGKWSFFIIWILALALLLFSGFRIGKTNWLINLNNWSYRSDHPAIRGNGIFSEKTFVLNEPITAVEIDENLYANLQIEQIQANTTSITISGDENLINRVKYDLKSGKLFLSSSNPFRIKNNLIIRLRTDNLQSIRSNLLGNIQLNRAFTGNKLEINMTGPGKFRADSLFVQSLTVCSEGVASVNLSGKVNKARFDLSGAGKIAAYELSADTVYAHIEGVGSIQCNPTEYLEGHLSGVGEITYKEEPKMKNITSEGIGKIKKK